MSRAQEGQILNTAEQQNQQSYQNAQQSYQNAQGDVQNYQNQLSQFAAANPYNAGGAFQTSQNQVLANTADAASQAAGQAMQSQAVRTGQNANAAVAGTEATTQADERNLAGQEGATNAQRIQNQAGYNQQVLGATSLPATLETTLSGQQAGAGNTALETGQKAADVPGFMDTLGDAFGAGLGKAGGQIAGGAIGGLLGCWVASRLWGGWADRRTVLVRLWLAFELKKRWYGRLLTAAYARHGEWAAESAMPRSPALTAALRWLFDRALERAEGWLTTRRGAEMYNWHNQIWRKYKSDPFARRLNEQEYASWVIYALAEWEGRQGAGRKILLMPKSRGIGGAAAAPPQVVR